MEFAKLSDGERAAWERICNTVSNWDGSGVDNGEDADEVRTGQIDVDGYRLLAYVLDCALDGDFDTMLNVVGAMAVDVSRYAHNEFFASTLKRAYEAGIAEGSAGCCCNLGNTYHDTSGTGAPEDYDKAIEIYQLGADRGDSQSSVNLGYIYVYGRGVQKDYQKAYECFARAALLANNPEAYGKLGDLYAYGNGVGQSHLVAFRLYNLAYQHGEDCFSPGQNYTCCAAHHLGDYYLKGIPDALQPNPDQALKFCTEAEVGYRNAIDAGLDYYEGSLRKVIASANEAREASEKKHELIRRGARNPLIE